MKYLCKLLLIENVKPTIIKLQTLISSKNMLFDKQQVLEYQIPIHNVSFQDKYNTNNKFFISLHHFQDYVCFLFPYLLIRILFILQLCRKP